MPLDGNGNASLVPGYFVQNGDTVLPSQHNPPLEDIASMLSQELPRDGRAPMTGNLRMGGNKVTELAAPTNPNDAARLADLSGGTEVIFEQSGFAVSSTSPFDITGIDPDFFNIVISGECTSVSSAATEVTVYLSIGSGGTWFDIPGAVTYHMAQWVASGSTNARRFLARLENLNDTASSIFYTAYRSNTPPTEINYFVTPAEFTVRPIDALRIRVLTTGAAKTVNFARILVSGVRK